jgi:protein required for attachment to host cells
VNRIVVANASRCRIFSQRARFSPLEEIADLTHPEARMKASDINADKPGRAFDRSGQGRHAMSASVEPTEEQADRFARTIAEQLERIRLQNGFDRLTIIADPRFLGRIRAHVSKPVDKIIDREISANMADASAEAILSKLRASFER